MKQYKVLCLTDHSGHSKENSVYSLLKAMQSHPSCLKVDVASRALEENNIFFDNLEFSEVYCTQVDQNFDFDVDGRCLINNLKKVSPSDYDLIFMRLPRPVSDEFLVKLKEYHQNKVIINDPIGIIECASKSFLLNFPELCPPMKLVKSSAELKSFAFKYETVLKPLREYGGKGIVRIKNGKVDDGNKVHDLDNYLTIIKEELETNGFLAMKFLKNVDQGDKRLIVVNGEIMAASLRLPAKDSWLCNVAQGGKSVPTEPTDKEHEMIKLVDPLLRAKGILIYGADTLVNDDGERILSEINTLSIGGFPQAQKQTGRPIINETMNKIFDYLDDKYE